MEKQFETTEARRRASENYRKKRERVEVLLPPGTIERMKAVGVEEKRKASFVRFAVEDMLTRMEDEKLEIQITRKEKTEFDLQNRMQIYMEKMLENQRAGRPRKANND